MFTNAREIILSQIPMSDTVREFIKAENWTFTDEQLGTLICNSPITREKERVLLRQLLTVTKDKALAGDIREHLDWEEKIDALVANNADGKAVYLVGLDDSKGDIRGCYTFLEGAVAYGKAECDESFSVKKWRPGEPRQIGETYFEKSGESYHAWTEEEEAPYDEWDLVRFEHKFFIAPNPFEQGDLVKRMDAPELGVVRTPRLLWDKDNQRCLNSGRNDATDVQIVVEFLCDGELYHDHVSPLLLERVTEWDNKDEWGLMKYASMTMRGEGSMEEILMFFRRYQSWLEAKKKVERGNDLHLLHHLCEKKEV